LFLFGSIIALLSLFYSKMSSIFSKKYGDSSCFFYSGHIEAIVHTLFLV